MAKYEKHQNDFQMSFFVFLLFFVQLTNKHFSNSIPKKYIYITIKQIHYEKQTLRLYFFPPLNLNVFTERKRKMDSLWGKRKKGKWTELIGNFFRVVYFSFDFCFLSDHYLINIINQIKSNPKNIHWNDQREKK